MLTLLGALAELAAFGCRSVEASEPQASTSGESQPLPLLGRRVAAREWAVDELHSQSAACSRRSTSQLPSREEESQQTRSVQGAKRISAFQSSSLAEHAGLC